MVNRKEVYRERERGKRAKWKPLVLARHGYKCFYCGNLVMPIVEIPDGYRVSQTPHFITYYDPIVNDLVTALIMTIDHVVPIADGGKTEIENLVPACNRCNQSQNKKRNPRHAKPCRGQCGLQVVGRRRRCRECRAKIVQEFRSRQE